VGIHRGFNNYFCQRKFWQHRKELLLCLLGLFLLFLSPKGTLYADSSTKKKVLLLHSYSAELLWVQNINRGVFEVFKNSGSEVNLFVEMMNTKRFNSPEYFDLFLKFIKQKYSQFEFDLILSVDNNAFTFLREHASDLFPGCPIAFCGVNDFKGDQIRLFPNFTGVAETISADKTVKTALKLHPATKKIFIINDYLVSGRAMANTIKKQLQEFEGIVELEWNDNQTFAELCCKVANLSKDTIILIGAYYADKTGDLVDYKTLGKKLFESSKRPIYACIDLFLKPGVIGGKMVSGYHQGKTMAKIGKRILLGERADSIPVVVEAANRWIVSHEDFARFGIDASQFPDGTLIINEPFSFYGKYRSIAIWTIVVIIVLLGLVLVLIFNIVSRRKFEKALVDSESRYRTLFNDCRDAILVMDVETSKLIDCNPSALEMFAIPAKDELGKYSPMDLSPEYQPCGRLSFELGKEEIEKTDEKSGHFFEWTHKRLTGEAFPATVFASRTSIDGRAVTIGAIRDLSEQRKMEREKKELERQLQQTSKMEAIGLMAGGVAHDLNNILAGIVSYPDMLLATLPSDSKMRKPLQMILKSGRRAAAVVADLLSIARSITNEKAVKDLNWIINEYFASTEFIELEQRYADVSFEKNLSDDLANISCSVEHIKSCLMNLLINAAEAIDGQGSVCVTTYNKYIDDNSAPQKHLEVGDYVVVKVVDSGSGIPVEYLDRIFEPFFTKKIMGRSVTGLGLAIIWNVMRGHDGAVFVESSDDGTCFELYFPACNSESVIEEVTDKLEDLKGSGQKILIVDDEAIQRDLAGQILKMLNYKSVSVCSGEDAIEVLKKENFDLVILDMIMDPGINGCQTYEELLKINPEQKAIIASGYSSSRHIEKVQSLGSGPLVKKPYTIETIAKVIKTELEK
jgi:PAS domain S-box-containing protein